MIATSKSKQTATRSYNFCQALTAIQELTQEELISLKKELGKKSSGKRILFKSNRRTDDHSFFLFGKWPDFEDAVTLREKAWKRNSI
jgi:hypothetical protein